MATKKVAALAQDLETLEKYLEEAKTQRELKNNVTIKVVAGDDIVLTTNHKMFYDGLIHTLETTIDQTKMEIRDLMFPIKGEGEAR